MATLATRGQQAAVNNYQSQLDAQRRIAQRHYDELRRIEEQGSQAASTRAAARRDNSLKEYNAQLDQQRRSLQRHFDETRRIEDKAVADAANRAASSRNRAVTGYYQQMGLSGSPTAIGQQTAQNAQTQAALRQFASRDIQQGLANIDRIVKSQTLVDANRQLAQLTQTTQAATRETGLFASAFKGAFVGAVTGFAVRATLGNIISLTTAIKDAAINAVRMAGDFQTTVNAMALFTGSTQSARAELASLSQLARDTPGLRLDDAQVGATRLRALGFEAKVAADLVAGIAKQKLVSGVTDEGAVQRVIVNLQQLRAGSPQIQRDIQQMILSIPSLSREINTAFGSLQKFKAALREDPNAAIEKFAKSLANAQAPALGFNEHLGILIDTYKEAARAFGDPLLEPLVETFKLLTGALLSNSNSFRDWGQSIADAVRVANDALAGAGYVSRLLGLDVADSEASTARLGLRELGRSAGAGFLVGGPVGTAAYNLYRSVSQIGALERTQAEQAALTRSRTNEGVLRNQLGYGANFIGPVSENMVGEQKAAREAQRARDDEEAERQRRNSLADLERNAKGAETILKNRYEQEQALLDSHLRNTSQEELAFTKATAVSKANFLKSDLARIEGYYAKALSLEVAGSEEQKKLVADRDAAISSANTAIYTNELETQKKIAEQEFRIYEERRQALIEFKDLQVREIEQVNESITQQLERQIELYGSGYDDLITETQGAYIEIHRITQDSFDLRLADASLTKEQTVNIYKEMYLELDRLAQQNAERVLAIEKKRLDEQARLLRDNAQVQQSLLGVTGGILGNVLGTLQPNATFGRGFPAAAGFISGATQGITGVQQGPLSFYEAQKNILSQIHEIEKLGLENEIKLNEKLIKIERERAVLSSRTNLAQAEVNLTRLSQQLKDAQDQQADPATVTRINDQLKATEARIAQYQATIASGGVGGTSETLRLENQNVILKNQKEGLEIAQSIAKVDLAHALDLQTINAETQAILKGEKDILITKTQQLSAAQQAQAIALEYRQQEVLLTNEQLLQQATQLEVQKEIVAVRNEELQAVFQIARAQVRIADQMVYSKNRADAAVLDFLASQKGITEIVSDAKINLLTTAYSGLESVADRLTRKFGAFRDVIRDLISNLLKLAVNKLFGSTLVGGGGGAGGGGVLGGLLGGGGGGGGILQGAFGGLSGGFGSGGGYGGTPAYGGGSGLPGLHEAGNVFGSGGSIGGGNLLSQGGLLGASLGGNVGKAGVGFGGILKGLGGILPMLPFLGAGLGAGVGGKSISGQILGGIGGALGGVAALGALAWTGALAGSGLAAGSIASLAALGPIAAVAAPLFIAGAYFLGRDKARKRDEKTRNQLMLDALRAMDNIIEGVKNNRMDGSAALEQAEQIRSQYLEGANALKEKKTRGIALKDVSRVDAKINELKAAVQDQARRAERLDVVPTFAAGGPAAGYQRGAGHGTMDNMPVYFPAAGRAGYVSPTEYILDAQTTANIGVNNLDTMRSTKGASFNQMRKRMTRFASGGSFAFPSSGGSGYAVTSDGGNQPIALEVSMNVGIAESQFAEVVAAYVKNANGSREQIQAIVKSLENAGGGDPALRKLANLLSDSIK